MQKLASRETASHFRGGTAVVGGVVGAVADCAAAIRAAVDAFHRENPLLPGFHGTICGAERACAARKFLKRA